VCFYRRGPSAVVVPARHRVRHRGTTCHGHREQPIVQTKGSAIVCQSRILTIPSPLPGIGRRYNLPDENAAPMPTACPWEVHVRCYR
jgi:hypothetical protein